jgi:hypothetical protein
VLISMLDPSTCLACLTTSAGHLLRTSLPTGVRQFMQQSIAAAHASGAVSTLMGRHRPISGLAGDFHKRSEAERKVVNSQIQVRAVPCCDAW